MAMIGNVVDETIIKLKKKQCGVRQLYQNYARGGVKYNELENKAEIPRNGNQAGPQPGPTNAATRAGTNNYSTNRPGPSNAPPPIEDPDATV